MAVAQDLRLRRGQALEGRQRLLGAPLLDDAQHRVEYDDRHDRGGIHPFAQQRRDRRGRDEQQHDEVVQLLPKHRQEAGGLGLLQLVWAKALQAFRGLVRSHPRIAHLQILQHLVHVQRMPGRLLDLADVPYFQFIRHSNLAAYCLLRKRTTTTSVVVLPALRVRMDCRWHGCQ